MNRIRAACLMLTCLTFIAATNAMTNAPQRLAPPASVTCDRNELTVYSGRITAYSRTPTRTTLIIATDWDTTERIVIRYPRGKTPPAQFLYEGRRFTFADWSRIERLPRKLRAGVRANIWVCGDARNPIVDWQGAAEPIPPASSMTRATRRTISR